ncbi:MAG: alanine racemase [Spirochaetota bacterium]|nr:MAG: alanine racemase [Spirochaetota bacterium]
MRKDELDTPEFLVDLDVLKKNINNMQKIADNAGIKLRPMVKTHKTPIIAKMQVEAGCSGVQTAKLEEAEVMADAGITDIFISHTIVGVKKIERLIKLAKRADITISVDNYFSADAISQVAEQYNMKLSLLIEIDVGDRRSGVMPGDTALKLANKITNLQGIDLRGIWTHEGNVNSAKNQKELKKASLASAKTMTNTAELLKSEGINVEVVSMGSTPSAVYVAGFPGITEIRPGTYIFNDINQVKSGCCKLEDCAASILVTIISTPRPNIVFFDAGSKAICGSIEMIRFQKGGIQAEWEDLEIGRIVDLDHRLLPGVRLEKVCGEYGFVALESNTSKLRIGDKIEVIPNIVDSEANYWDAMTVVEKGEVVESWPIVARGKYK